VRFDPSDKRIYIRQSWLGDALICPQRSRYGLALPSMRRGSDATAIGTGVHAGIESFLRGDVTDVDSFVGNIRTAVGLELDKDIRRTEISADPEKMDACVVAMATAWWDDIRPYVPTGGSAEVKFQAPTGLVASNEYEVWLEGTMDYVAPDGSIWDWKTASRAYYAREKHLQSHQATVYVDASRTLGLVPDGSEPTPFRFGVMVRQATPKAQIVTVLRGRNHIDYLRRQALSVVNMAISSWGTQDWMMNDQHNLCSSKWCDYWHLCKGAHWDATDTEIPDQIVRIVDKSEPT